MARRKVTADLRANVAGGSTKLLEVGLIATRPVCGLLNKGSTQNVEHLVESVLVDDVANTHEVDVFGGYLDGEVTLRHVQFEVEALFTPNRPLFDLGNRSGPVVRVDDCFSNNKLHIDFFLPKDTPVYHGDATPISAGLPLIGRPVCRVPAGLR
jgi:hypothetical protein